MDPDFVAILACPLEATRPPLELRDAKLVCNSCGATFPVIDGIPRLLPEDAVFPRSDTSRK